MKRLKLFFACLLMAVLSIGQMWADQVTFNYGDYAGQGGPSGSGSEYTMSDKDDVSIGDTKFYGNSSFVNLYANGVTTITPASGVTITQLVINASAASYNGYQSGGTMTWSTGSASANDAVVTWTGSATSVFTLTHNKQIRWTSIVVTYTKSGGDQGGGDQGGGGSNEEAEGTGTITFGSGDGNTNVNAASVTGDDDRGKTWTVTTEGTTSFTPNASYAQIGSGNKPASSITFTTTLSETMSITAFSASFGGFNGTAGTVTLKVGETTVGTGSLNGTSDVTVNATNTTTSGTVLTVTVTGISKGVKAYSISYTVAAASTPDPGTPTVESIEIVSGPTKTTYCSEDAFDLTGLVVKAILSDQSEENPVDHSKLSLSAIDKAADKLNVTQPITVTYGGKTATFDITLVPYTPAGAAALIPNKNDTKSSIYTEGIVTRKDPNDWNAQYGNIIYWISADGTTTDELEVYRGKGIDAAKFTAFDDLKEGDKVIVYGNLKNFNNTKEYDQNSQLISHTNRVLSSIAITGNLTNTAYVLNSTAADLNYAGLTVTATYQTGFTLDITNDVEWSIVPATLSTPGDAINVTITASYTEGEINKTTTKEVSLSISDKELVSISIPDAYAASMKCGQAMPKPTVLATFDDGADPVDVTSACEFTEVNLVEPGVHTITVTYTYGEVSKTAEYELTINAYSVEEIQDVIPAEGVLATSVEGVIRWIGYVNEGGFAKYSISATGSKDDADTLLIYNSYAGKDDNGYVNFVNTGDIELGDKVIVSGNFVTYSGTKETKTKESYISTLTKKALASIAISGDLSKTEYQVGQSVSASGLIVTATYNTDYQQEVTSSVEWTMDPVTFTTTGDEVAVTLTASYTENNVVQTDSKDATVKVIAAKQAAGLAYAVTEYNAYINGSFTKPVLTNPNNLTVTYSSSDDDLALVDENTGEVVIGSQVGVVTITASFAGNDGFNPGSASYTIDITDPSSIVVTFDATQDIATDNEAGVTKNNITVKTSHVDGINDQSNPISYYQCFKNANFEVSCSVGYIKRLEFTCESSNPISGFDNATGLDKVNNEWTGEAETVTLTAGGKQVRVNTLVVTYTPDNREEAGISFAEAEYDAIIGEDFTAPTLTNPNDLTVTYSSSDDDLALVDENSGEVVIGTTEGTVTITAAFAGNDDFKPASVSYNIVIAGTTPTYNMSFNLAKASYDVKSNDQVVWNSNVVTITADKATATTNADNYLGESGTYTSSRFYKNSTLTIAPKEGITIVRVEYNATNAGYAEALATSTWTNATATNNEADVIILPTNGANNIVATIGATTGANEIKVFYKASEAKEKLAASISAMENVAVARGGDITFDAPTTTPPFAKVKYAYEDGQPEIGTLSNKGIITNVTADAGTTTTIKAFTIDMGNYAAASVTFTVTVTEGKLNPELSYAEDAIFATLGEAFTAPTLTNPNNLTVTYSSSDDNLATVDENTGEVTLVAAGDVTITASFDGNDDYKAGSAEYTITIYEAPVVGTSDVVIVAKFGDKWYALKNTNGSVNNSLAAVEVNYIDGKILNFPEEEQANITWTRNISEGKASFLNGTKYITGASSTNLTLGTTECKWTISGTSYLQDNNSRTFIYNKDGYFKNYATSNAVPGSATYSEMPIVTEAVFVEGYIRTGLEVDRHYTVCLPKNITAIDGATFWSLSKRNEAGTAAYLESEDAPEAGKPYIIQATKTVLKVVYGENVETAPVENGALRGTFEYMNADALAAAGSNIYMLFNNELRPIGTNNHLDAHRAYVLYNQLEPVSSAPNAAPGKRVKSMPMQRDAAQGIENIESGDKPMKVMIDGTMYILRGEKVYDATGRLVK